jgi:hypothetical protein
MAETGPDTGQLTQIIVGSFYFAGVNIHPVDRLKDIQRAEPATPPQEGCVVLPGIIPDGRNNAIACDKNGSAHFFR